MLNKPIAHCILHIGTEKTGSKVIQDYLNRNRGALKRSKVLFPKPIENGQLSQWEYVAAVHPNPWEQDIGRFYQITDSASQSVFREKLKKHLARQIKQNPSANKLIISSEHFQSRLPDAKSVAELKEFLSSWVEKFSIVVYFRRQDQFAISLLSTRVKSYVPMSKTRILRELGDPLRYFDYYELFSLWGGVFGENSIRARLHDARRWPENDLLKDFCRTARIHHNGERAKEMNVSLSREAFQFLMAVNNMYPITPGDQSDHIRRRLVDEISAMLPGKYYPITRAQAREFYDQFHASNKRLKRVAFKSMDEPLFCEDFSEYPEALDEDSPDYKDAVAIAVSLWGQHMRKSERNRGFFRRIKTLLPWSGE